MRSIRLYPAILLPWLLLAATGCSTLADVRLARGTGSSRNFDVPFADVWDAIPRTANELDLAVVGSYKDDGYVLAERGVTAFSWGEKVAIFADPVGPSKTSVEVVSRRVLATNITAPNWERTFLEKLGEVIAERLRGPSNTERR